MTYAKGEEKSRLLPQLVAAMESRAGRHRNMETGIPHTEVQLDTTFSAPTNLQLHPEPSVWQQRFHVPSFMEDFLN